MLKTGLVSISFRDLTTDQITKMVKSAGLDAIEWGGDVHVPHGDVYKAEIVMHACGLNDISCPSYGSYYRVGEYDDPKAEYKKVLNCAVALKSDVIRVWAGVLPTKEADKEHWELIAKELKLICSMTSHEGKDVALEYHANTLTDNCTDTLRLLAKVNAANLTTYWQPPVGLSHEENLHDIKMLKRHISNIHTFTWKGRERMPLEDGFEHWQDYFLLVNTWKMRYCLLEFIKDNSEEGFYRDARTLMKLTAPYK